MVKGKLGVLGSITTTTGLQVRGIANSTRIIGGVISANQYRGAVIGPLCGSFPLKGCEIGKPVQLKDGFAVPLFRGDFAGICITDTLYAVSGEITIPKVVQYEMTTSPLGTTDKMVTETLRVGPLHITDDHLSSKGSELIGRVVYIGNDTATIII